MAKLVKLLLFLSLIINCSFLILALSASDIINTADVQSGTLDSNQINNRAIIKDVNTTNSNNISDNNNPKSVVSSITTVPQFLSRTGGYQIGSYIVSLFTILILISYFLYENQNNNKKN
jgi:predicted PurR-regulated permease PerM